MIKEFNVKLILVSLLLLISIGFSGWLYWISDIKMEQVLTKNEWQSNTYSVIFDDSQIRETIGPLRNVQVSSNVKYLPNGNYIRVSTLKLLPKSSDSEVIVNISESGKWDISDNYLLLAPGEFKDLSASKLTAFTAEQLTLITQVFKMDAQQSRRIDIVNDKTLLLTSLDHGSTVLFSN